MVEGPILTAEEDSDLDGIVGGIKCTIRRIAYDLENVTKFWDRNFKGLDAAELPEYQDALKAIEVYKEALAAHFAQKYRESETPNSDPRAGC